MHTALLAYFRSQASWRWYKAERYPTDRRNEQSARALDALASYIEAADEPEVIQSLSALEAHLFDGVVLGDERTAREVSRYGYGYDVGASQHMSLLRDLVHLCAWDAYEHLRHYGGGTHPEGLDDLEVDAARDGVGFPKRYWLYRSVWSASQREEAVESYRASAAPSITSRSMIGAR